jgi:hypothetical protein
MSPVSVSPETFTMVHYEADRIVAVAEKLIADLGLPADIDVRVEVDESSPLGRAKLASMEPLTVTVESGALEDAKRPRQLSEQGTADVLGRILARVRDRLDPAFGDPPADDELPLPYAVSWDVYAVARLARLGYHSQRQRRLYHFRNRHGFTDAADAAFERLWQGEGLTWADITAISDEATAAREPQEA